MAIDHAVSTLGIVGVGLIGGSLSLALKKNAAVGKVIGFGRSESRLTGAKQAGIIDDFECTSYARAAECDVIVICVPVRTMPAVFGALAPHIGESSVITDAGSVKGYVVDKARTAFADNMSRFVPGHPIAGTEKSGFEAAYSTLYCDRRVILTPDDNTLSSASALVERMWTAAGAEVVSMPVERHDQVLAATSHLPHLLAYGLVDCLAQLDDHDAIFRFAAGGFRDFTRIASSDVDMWRDISFTNRAALIDVLDQYQSHMAYLKRALMADDEEAIGQSFENARTARAEYLENYEPGASE